MLDVYTLNDLVSRAHLDAGQLPPARLAVIGHPVAHSASPRMHQAALDADGIAMRYIRVEVAPGMVGEAFARMRALGFTGCNVTVPHKFEALAACDDVAAGAKALGAVNTVRFDQDLTRGFNTDGPGFVDAIDEEFGVGLAGLTVVMLGAGGGAGQALAMQCAMQGVTRLVLVNRTLAKLPPLMARLREQAPDCEVTAMRPDDPALQRACKACELVVNASSAGLKADDPPILPADCLKPQHMVYDCIYRPTPTHLLEMAAALGCRTANGLSMLVRQGALAYQLWFPQTSPWPVMHAAMT